MQREQHARLEGASPEIDREQRDDDTVALHGDKEYRGQGENENNGLDAHERSDYSCIRCVPDASPHIADSTARR